MRDKWKKNTLGEYVKLQGGFAFSSNSFRESGIPLVRISNITNSGISNKFAYLPIGFLIAHSEFSLNEGDIVIAMSGATTGKNCQISSKHLPALLNQRAGRFVVNKKDELSNEFLAYVVNSREFQNELLIDAVGGAQPNISSRQIENLSINLPPLPQQRKIAQILSTCDTVIEKTEAAIAKYQAIKQGMMHDLFTRGIDLSTGKLRPKNEDAPELYKESELGMIPKEWEVKRLEEFGSFKKGSNIPKYLLTPNGVGCILYGQLYTTFHDVIEQSYTKIPENHVKGMSPLNQGDILFAGSGETHEEIGKCAVLLSGEEIYAGGDIVILSLSENYCKPYFGYLLNFEPIQKQKAKLGQGSSVIHIYSNHLGSIKLSLPNKMEQEVVHKKIQSISQKISFEESTLSKYHQIKSGLMQDLLNGDIEVEVGEKEFEIEN